MSAADAQPTHHDSELTEKKPRKRTVRSTSPMASTWKFPLLACSFASKCLLSQLDSEVASGVASRPSFLFRRLLGSVILRRMLSVGTVLDSIGGDMGSPRNRRARPLDPLEAASWREFIRGHRVQSLCLPLPVAFLRQPSQSLCPRSARPPGAQCRRSAWQEPRAMEQV